MEKKKIIIFGAFNSVISVGPIYRKFELICIVMFNSLTKRFTTFCTIMCNDKKKKTIDGGKRELRGPLVTPLVRLEIRLRCIRNPGVRIEINIFF